MYMNTPRYTIERVRLILQDVLCLVLIFSDRKFRLNIYSGAHAFEKEG